MTVSVALCTYNGQRFIEAQIDSILSQSVLPDELVVSDDASKDNTLALIRARVDAFGDGAPRLTILENRSALGVTANFEKAILATSGDLIILSDQDDVWAPDRVELTVRAFADPDVMLVHGDAHLIDANGDRLPSSLFDSYGVDAETRELLASRRAFELLLRRNLITGATAAIRRSVAEQAAPFPASWVHDEWLAIVAAATGSIVPLENELIGYRQHGNNEIGAVQLTLRSKIRKLTEPGSDRNRRILERAVALAERYPELASSTPDRLALVELKRQHEVVRSGLRRSRFSRIGPVLREARTGRYSQFGGGLQDIVRDLVQPLNPRG